MLRHLKNENKGFSLVELIVVVAIMGALIAILTPAFLQYVEKTRKQLDETAAGEILHAAEIVVFSGSYEVTDAALVTFDRDGISIPETEVADALEEELTKLFGDLTQTVTQSDEYEDKTYTISIKPVAGGTGTQRSQVVGEWGETTSE